MRHLRGGLQLSDISENPNNDRIGGDPPTHPPNPNKCLMPDAFVVLHIPGVHIGLLPTTSTVQGVNSSFIPTENSDERLDCACAVVTNTGLNLSLPWLDQRGWTRLPWRWHYPGNISPCPFGLSKFQEVRPASSSFKLLKSISHSVIRTVTGSEISLKKGFFQLACISKPTRSLFSSTHTKCGWRAGEKYSLSHEASPRRPLTCESTNTAKQGESIAPTAVTDLLAEPRPPTSLKQEQRSRNRETAQLFYLKQDWSWSAQPLDFWNYPKLSSVGHFQSEQAFTPPTHFRTLFGFSEKFSNCRPSLKGLFIIDNS